MKIKILDSARNDLTIGYYFYENQDAGLGSLFLECLFSEIDSLQTFAGIHEVQFTRYFRLLSRRFPHAIFYRVEKDEILVYAVLDCRMDPDTIKRLLD